MRFKTFCTKSIFAASLAVMFFAAGSTPARADREDRCHRDFRHAQENLDKAVRKHGEHSRQAEKRRRELEEVRDRCHMR